MSYLIDTNITRNEDDFKGLEDFRIYNPFR